MFIVDFADTFDQVHGGTSDTVQRAQLRRGVRTPIGVAWVEILPFQAGLKLLNEDDLDHAYDGKEYILYTFEYATHFSQIWFHSAIF